MKKSKAASIRTLVILSCFAFLMPESPMLPVAQAASGDAIKAYCLDFNWAPTRRRNRPIATPGQWADADPEDHVDWYEAMGANVIQTFAVSTNGYAWYKDGFVPEQPGLKHDFLPEMVKLGHKRGMKVFGYFTIATNPRWAELHPDHSYGISRTYHIPYTDKYLDFLSKAIHDAVRRTGIDGFMIDWVWMPKRDSTKGKWIESEKQLYKKLMGEDFPGEGNLTKKQDTAYSRKAIERCWQTIREAAKSADPDCIVWLTVNKMHHPHVTHSRMYKEVDWLMNEAGRVSDVIKAREMVGKHTQLITCLAAWNGVNPLTIVPEAIREGVGLYGFTTPLSRDGIVKLEPIFRKQVTELSGDDKNIAMLARAYRGKSEYAEWTNGEFVEPKNPPPFRLTFQRRGRGLQDTGRIDLDKGVTRIAVKTPYGRGSGTLTKTGKQWPKKIVFELQKKPGKAPPETTHFAITDGKCGVIVPLDSSGAAQVGELDSKAKVHFSKHIKFALRESASQIEVSCDIDEEQIQIPVPDMIYEADPEKIQFQWGN